VPDEPPRGISPITYASCYGPRTAFAWSAVSPAFIRAIIEDFTLGGPDDGMVVRGLPPRLVRRGDPAEETP
jgi:hypothetical protein